jgi:hypothetical protein
MLSLSDLPLLGPPYLESVDNALRLVLLLARISGISVSDASREVGLARSTIHRLLSTNAISRPRRPVGRSHVPARPGDGGSFELTLDFATTGGHRHWTSQRRARDA